MMIMHSGKNTLKMMAKSAVLSLFVMGAMAHAAVILRIVEMDVPDDIFGDDVVAYDFLLSSDQELRAVSLEVTLNDGWVMHNADPANLGGNKRPLDALLAIPTFQNLRYDTYVDLPISSNAGSQDDVIVLGRAQGDLKDFDPNDLNFEPDPALFGLDRLSVSWGSTTFVDSPIVDYPIARVTVVGALGSTLGPLPHPGDVGVADLVFFVADDDPNNQSGQVGKKFHELLPTPEPNTLALVAGLGVMMLKRRCRTF